MLLLKVGNTGVPEKLVVFLRRPNATIHQSPHFCQEKNKSRGFFKMSDFEKTTFAVSAERKLFYVWIRK